MTTDIIEDLWREIALLKRRLEIVETAEYYEDWIAPTLLNSWVNWGGVFSPVGYRKDENGLIYLRGLVKSGTIGQPIFTLPAGYRPAYQTLFVTISAGAVGRCDIQTNGDVVAYGGSNVSFSLDLPPFLAA